MIIYTRWKKKFHCTFVHFEIEQRDIFYGKAPPISISLSKPNDVEDKNGSWPSGDNGSIWLLLFEFPFVFIWSILSSSPIPNAERESSGGNVSNVAKIGVGGGTNGFVGLFNEEDKEDGSCLIRLEVARAIAGVGFVGELTGIPFNKHFFSKSWKIKKGMEVKTNIFSYSNSAL